MFMDVYLNGKFNVSKFNVHNCVTLLTPFIFAYFQFFFLKLLYYFNVQFSVKVMVDYKNLCRLET